MKLGELFVQLGVKADTFTVRDFTKAIGDIPFSVASAVTSLTGLSLGFVELTQHTLGMANNLGIFTAQTGLSIEQLQKWQSVAKQTGVSAEAVQGSIMGITQALAAMRTGHADPNFMLAMGQLGVSPFGKNAYQILQEIMRATRGRDPAVVSDLLRRANISPDMMRIFSLGPGKFSEMSRNGVVMNESEMRAMQDFQMAIGRLVTTIEQQFVPVIVAFEPYMKDLTEVMAATLAKAGGIAGYGIGETARLLNEMRKSGGFSNFMDNLITSGLSPEEFKKSGAFSSEVNVTQHIYSTASAEDVADEAARLSKRELTNANKNFNNSGF